MRAIITANQTIQEWGNGLSVRITSPLAPLIVVLRLGPRHRKRHPVPRGLNRRLLQVPPADQR